MMTQAGFPATTRIAAEQPAPRDCDAAVWDGVISELVTGSAEHAWQRSAAAAAATTSVSSVNATPLLLGAAPPTQSHTIARMNSDCGDEPAEPRDRVAKQQRGPTSCRCGFSGETAHDVRVHRKRCSSGFGMTSSGAAAIVKKRPLAANKRIRLGQVKLRRGCGDMMLNPLLWSESEEESSPSPAARTQAKGPSVLMLAVSAAAAGSSRKAMLTQSPSFTNLCSNLGELSVAISAIKHASSGEVTAAALLADAAGPLRRP